MGEPRRPRDGTCPGCSAIICYLLDGDVVWQHSDPRAIYHSGGKLDGIEGKGPFDVIYPNCVGSGGKALDPYTPVTFDAAWESKPHYEIRMILKQGAGYRKVNISSITG